MSPQPNNYFLIAILIALLSVGCLNCAVGQGTNPGGVCKQCSTLISQCSTCITYQICTQCNSNYQLSPGNTSCLACSLNVVNCQSCVSTTNCTKCLSGYYLANITACVSCDSTITNCQLCDQNGTCTQCVAPYFLYNSTCFVCTLNGCSSCTGASTCGSCSIGYYLDANNTCAICKDSNCVNCSSELICQQCKTDFTLNPTKTACVCQTGSIVTGVCLAVLGCVTATKVNNISTCLFCDSLGNFIISGTTCVCKTGYKLTNTQCFTLCGDGLTISPQTCDDSNTASGDGCSSTCQLEPNYSCSYDNSSVYKCLLTSTFITNLLYIQKTDADNSCTYYFSVSPSSPNFLKVNLTNYLQLIIPSSTSYKANSVSYNEGIIQIGVSFTEDIQNMASYLVMNFDPSYFNTSNFIYSFVSTGTNNPLIVSNYPAYLKYFKIGCYIILGIVVLVLILSVVYEKMIAIETINILQLIFFTRLLYVQNDLIVSDQIFNLRYIMGYNDIDSNMKQTHQIPLTYRRLLFNTDFILNFQTGLLFMIISLVILIIMQIYKRKSLGFMSGRKGASDQFKLVEQKVSEKERFVYERIILLIACITLFSCLAAVRLQSRILNTQQHYSYFFLNLLAMMFSLLYIFSTLTYQVLNVGKIHTWLAPFCSYSPYYIGYYVCYILIITPIFVSGEYFLGLQAIYLVSGMVFAHTIIMVVWRPYKQAFHNFANIFNNGVLLAVLGITKTLKFTSKNENLSLLFAYALLGLFFLIQFFAIVRICLATKPLPKETQRLNRNSNEQDEANREFQTIQKELFTKHELRSKNPISRAQMQQQQLIRLKNRLKMEFKQKNEEQTFQL